MQTDPLAIAKLDSLNATTWSNAQWYATMAVAEELRTANLIALAAHPVAHLGDHGTEIRTAAAAQAIARLGLTP